MIKEVVFDIDDTLYDYEKGPRAGRGAYGGICRKRAWNCQSVFSERIQADERRAEGPSGKGRRSHPQPQHPPAETCWSSGASPCFPMWRSCIICTGTLCLQRARRSREVSRPIRALRKMGIGVGIGTDMTFWMQYQKLERFGFAPYITHMVRSQEAQ